MTWTRAALAGCLAAAALAGCTSTDAAAPPASTVTTAPPATTTPAPTSAPTSAPLAPTPTRAAPPSTATPAPAWLGTRPLPTGASGLGIAQDTPPELRDRRIVTVDELPPPAGGRFRGTVAAVPPEVALRSTWTTGCPVTLEQLRYVTVSFRGFDGAAHTGELLVHREVAEDVVEVFRRLFAAGFPIERMVIATQEDLVAAPTGDGNTTGSFVCRPVVGTRTTWSEHAYGRAIDVNPFQNPRVDGDSVVPELATAYTDRDRRRAGMITRSGPVVRAFRAVGWEWGGNFRRTKDWMHFSVNGR